MAKKITLDDLAAMVQQGFHEAETKAEKRFTALEEETGMKQVPA